MSAALSVVLPVRNAEETLPRALESCLSQTWADFDLVVVLNGCTDRSEAIAEQFCKEDARVRVLQSDEQGGVAGAMAKGVQETDAPLIARMDADDYALPTRFEQQREALEEEPALAAVSCGVRLLNGLGAGMERYVEWVNELKDPAAVARERFIECPVIQPSLMMRRSALAQAGGYLGVEWAEDHDLFLRMLAQGARFGKVPEVLLEWQDSERRLTRSHPAYGEEQVWRMKAHHLSQLPSIQERGVVISGAGPIGKRLARLLQSEGVAVHGFFEVNVRRVGCIIGGIPVAGLEEFGLRWRMAVLLSAVGVEGGRGRVRELALTADYVEGEDFFATC